jgi:light-regulated signal transduction histidine kinase (bacteriophytochrome)
VLLMRKRTINALEQTTSRRPGSTTEARSLAAGTAGAKEGSAGLQEHIAALEAELAIYREALKNSREDMQSFAYSVSHDLKAPIRAIEGFSKILLDDFAGELSAEAQRFLKHIVANTETLSGQVEDLLRYYRAGKNPPVLLSVDLDSVAREIISTLPPQDTARMVIIEKLPTVIGDALQLREVLSQLISNALKFSARAQNPTIEIRGAREKEATSISIQDHGVGFDPKHASKLFQVFHKLHTTTDFPGNGIGLAIVKRLVLAHGGCVQANAAPDQGATFTVTLPNTPVITEK